MAENNHIPNVPMNNTKELPVDPNYKKINKIHHYEQYFKRTEINEEDLEKKYSYQAAKSPDLLYGTKRYFTKHYKPSLICIKNYSLKRVPFFEWIIKYNIKEDLLKDLIAGLTVGIIQIPQGKFFTFFIAYLNLQINDKIKRHGVFINGWTASYCRTLCHFFYCVGLRSFRHVSSFIVGNLCNSVVDG
jgi:hypothetical protein